MSFSFLMVLPKEMRSMATPVACTSSISPRLAVSNFEPSRRQARQDLRRRIGLHGIEDVGRRQQLAHAPEVVLDHVEVDHQARRLGLLLSEITKNTLGHRWGVPRQSSQSWFGEKRRTGRTVPNRQRASADTRRGRGPQERKIERSGPVGIHRANDRIAGYAPRTVSNHLRSSFPDPALRRHCQKGRFPSLRNHYGPAARAWAS